MFDFSTEQLITYGIAAGAAIITAIMAWWGFLLLRDHQEDASYDKQLQDLLNGDSDEDELLRLERGRNFTEKWNLYWQRVGYGTGLSRYSEKNNSAPRDVILFWIITFVVVAILLRSPIFAFLAASGGLYAFGFLAKFRYNRQVMLIQGQLPYFLFALKSNVQANETPQRALLKVVDNMPEPLRSDLMIVKQKLLANSTFEESLQELVERTNSNELRFLATCLIQASGTGANITPQLDTIQRVLEQRKRAADELAKAVRGTIPAIVVSSAAIPLSFGATYIMDPTAKNFWFQETLSWVAMGLIVFLYGLGMWLTRRMVENIRNL